VAFQGRRSVVSADMLQDSTFLVHLDVFFEAQFGVLVHRQDNASFSGTVVGDRGGRACGLHNGRWLVQVAHLVVALGVDAGSRALFHLR
jgi:hypothetical protein